MKPLTPIFIIQIIIVTFTVINLSSVKSHSLVINTSPEYEIEKEIDWKDGQFQADEFNKFMNEPNSYDLKLPAKLSLFFYTIHSSLQAHQSFLHQYEIVDSSFYCTFVEEASSRFGFALVLRTVGVHFLKEIFLWNLCGADGELMHTLFGIGASTALVLLAPIEKIIHNAIILVFAHPRRTVPAIETVLQAEFSIAKEMLLVLIPRSDPNNSFKIRCKRFMDQLILNILSSIEAFISIKGMQSFFSVCLYSDIVIKFIRGLLYFVMSQITLEKNEYRTQWKEVSNILFSSVILDVVENFASSWIQFY